MNTAALMICVAGFLGVPAPAELPVIREVDSAFLQEVCRNTGNRLYLGCYVIETKTVYIDRDVIRGGVLAHELGHHITWSAGIGLRFPHHQMYWAATRADVGCRQ